MNLLDYYRGLKAALMGQVADLTKQITDLKAQNAALTQQVSDLKAQVIILMSRLVRVGSTASAPVAPTISLGTATSSTQPVTISAQGSGATSWQMQYAIASSGSWSNFGSLSVGDTSITVTGLTASTSYDYRIVATNAAGSTNSNTATGSTASGSSFDFYISTTGSDSNPGTLASPWAITSLLCTQSSSYNSTIAANKTAMAGKRVGLLDGTYHVAQYAAGINDPDWVVLNPIGGSSGSPTIIEAVNPRLAIIEGTDSGGTNRVNTYYSSGCGIIGQSYLHAGTKGYVTLKNLVIRKGFRYLVHWRYNGAIADGPRYSGVTVEGCDISDVNNTGQGAGDNISCIQSYTTDGAVYRNNKIYNARGESSSAANGYGIQEWSCNNTTFEYNTITNCKDGIYVKNLYQTGKIVRYNYIDLTAYDGGGVTNGVVGFEYSTASTQHLNMHHNVVVASNGFRCHDLGTILQGPCQIWNNTLVSTGTAFSVVGLQGYGGTQPIDCYNNIIYRSGASSEEGDIALNTGNTGIVDYNCYPASPKLCTANSTNNYPDNSYITLASWRTATPFDDHAIASSPGFAASGSNADYYKLSGGSACLNAGKSDGTAGGTTCDIGAWSNGNPTTIGCDF